MKAILGVDPQGSHESALELLARLQFPNLSLIALCAAEPIPEVMPAFGPVMPTSENIFLAIQKHSEAMAAKVAEEAAAKGIPAKPFVPNASAGRALIEASESEVAELLVVGTRQKSGFEAAILGSVMRAVVVGSKDSVLIGRGSVPAGDLHAVFATDLSHYNAECVDWLLARLPLGLKKVTVVGAYQLLEDQVASAGHRLVISPSDVGDMVRRNVLEQVEAVAQRFRDAGLEASAIAEQGKASDVIEAAFRESGAHLAIIGAQGHGFFERLLIGSTSMHLATKAQMPLLIIRP